MNKVVMGVNHNTARQWQCFSDILETKRLACVVNWPRFQCYFWLITNLDIGNTQKSTFSTTFKTCRCVFFPLQYQCLHVTVVVCNQKNTKQQGTLRQDSPSGRAWSNLAVIKIELKPTPRLDFIYSLFKRWKTLIYNATLTRWGRNIRNRSFFFFITFKSKER